MVSLKQITVSTNQFSRFPAESPLWPLSSEVDLQPWKANTSTSFEFCYRILGSNQVRHAIIGAPGSPRRPTAHRPGWSMQLHSRCPAWWTPSIDLSWWTPWVHLAAPPGSPRRPTAECPGCCMHVHSRCPAWWTPSIDLSWWTPWVHLAAAPGSPRRPTTDCPGCCMPVLSRCPAWWTPSTDLSR